MPSFTQGDYMYSYDVGSNEVNVEAISKTKSSYEAIPPYVIYNDPTYGDTLFAVTSAQDCFRGCENLTTVGGLPETLINMTDCFNGCIRLVNAPQIPYGVIHMTRCFYACTSLQTAPVVPGSVLYASGCFEDCEALGGDVYIDATGYTQGQSIYAVNFTNIFRYAGLSSDGLNIFIIVDFETSTQHYARRLATDIVYSLSWSTVYFMCKPQQYKSYNNGNLSILRKDSDNNVTTLNLPLETNASLVDVSIPALRHRGGDSGEISTNLEYALIDLYLQASERGSA